LTLIANIGKGAVLSANCGKGITYGSDVLTNGDMEAWTATYCAQYQTVYDSFTTKPSAAEAAIWNTFVASIVGTGEWAKLDILDIFSTHINSDSEALKNWKNPGTFDPTLVNNPAFGINEGFTGNGSNAHINLNWNPSVDGVNYQRDSASYGCYARTDIDSIVMGAADAGVANGSLFGIAGANYASRINAASAEVVAYADPKGMFIVNRDDATDNDVYRNKIRVIDGSTASTGLTSKDFYALAWNFNGSATNLSSCQVSMIFAGAGFTQTNVNNLTDAYETALDALGKGVI